ncbi:hypothetical protein [Desulfonatronovibrio magnus]|uniref:hypothetical protein n=1 Tax=Desulfonatronovibrio magnus TaxID=698827 RepID=UPI0005EB2A57|nr:hypothetical protein [Desulfonatronovibrio magnus]
MFDQKLLSELQESHVRNAEEILNRVPEKLIQGVSWQVFGRKRVQVGNLMFRDGDSQESGRMDRGHHNRFMMRRFNI